MEENWLVKAVEEKTGLSKEKIEAMVKEKISQFPALEENAALRMIATENGVVPVQRVFKVNEVNRDINHLDLSGVVSRKFSTKQITLNGRAAQLLKFFVADETGEIGVVVWDTNKIAALEASLHEGDSVTIVNGYSKKNKFNDTYEINIGKVGTVNINSSSSKFVKLSNISKTGSNRIRAFLVRLFTDNTFLVKCTICNKRVIDKCDIHGDKALSKVLMLTGIIDDGNSNMRITFFDKVGEKLLSLANGGTLEEKLADLSFGLYQLDIVAVVNEFNGNISLTARDVSKVNYDLQ
ncbi:MAG: hypothetical protein RAK22_00280 [Nanoarchaeota archaeon]|nr:hypothetical protein [Nanoarchaeota archaeon]